MGTEMIGHNKLGLSRHVPADVKFTLRKEAGFGCVCCGNAIIEYEHIDPEFADAQCHDPKCMTILCGGCHSRVTKGLLSKETVKIAKAKPFARQEGFSFEAFDLGTASPIIQLGNSTFVNCANIITVSGKSLFAIKSPKEDSGPFLLDAEFCDSNGKLLFSVKDNEYKIETENFDVEIIGKITTFRNAAREVTLQLEANPPIGVTVKKMDMLAGGARFYFDKEQFCITSKDQSRFQGYAIGKYSGFSSVFDVSASGLSVGLGGGSMI